MTPSKNDLCNNNMRSISSIRIVDDDVEEQRIPRSTGIIRPVPQNVRTLVKPVAIKVVRPIPQRVTEQFYKEACEEGLNLMETSVAAAIANDWHRKWTQQDEQNHTTPNADFYATSALNTVEYDFDADRLGARNPSIFSDDASETESFDGGVKRSLHFAPSPQPASPSFLFNPEDRLSASSWSESHSSSLSSHLAPQVKRRFVGAPVFEDNEDEVEEPVLHAPVPIRPSAVRPVVVRPVHPNFQQSNDYSLSGVPQDIMTARRQANVSPMSYSDSSMNFQEPEMTLYNEPAVHVVEDIEEPSCTEVKSNASKSEAVMNARDSVLYSLAITQGDVDSSKFVQSLDPLLKYFSQKELDTRPSVVHQADSVDGMWLTLSKPTYFGCLGENDNGDPMYTLGRMAFDMFSPTNLVCSLQGNFNPVEVVCDEDRKKMLEQVPKALREEVESGKTVLRTYHVVTAFTIEPPQAAFPNAPNKDVHRPIKGIMTTFGYSLPDPNVPNRHSIWFTGGRIEPNNDPADIVDWTRLFTLHPPKHSWGEKAKLLAVKLLMGATVPESMADDGSMEFAFTRPLGGHGMAYVDVVYLDETLRIVRGHRGTIMVFSRIHQDKIH